MANITIATETPAGNPAVNLGALLTTHGHTPTIKDETTLTGSSESTQALIICIDNALNNTTLRDNLNTHMGTHSVPVMLCWSSQGGGGQFSTGHIAALLGIVANVLEFTSAGSTMTFDDSHQDEGATDAWVQGTAIPVTTTTEFFNSLASPDTDSVGIDLMNAAVAASPTARPVVVAARATDARTLGVGGTFATKILFNGFINGESNTWTDEAEILIRSCVNWCLDLYEVGFPI